VISQGAIVAEKLEDYLQRHTSLSDKLSKSGTIQFLTTESAVEFDKKASVFFGREVKSEHIKL
jgi:glutamate racemase